MARKDPYVQELRGLAISAVVLIHCLPESPASVVLRPFLNWSVALFLFLSGMLTTEEKVLRGGVIKDRLTKVVVPYLVWSCIYLMVSPPDTALGIVKALLTGGASAQLYYLLVYVQLMLLTPLLFRLLRTHSVLLYAVTPCALVTWGLLALLRVDAPNIAVLFPTWLVYYVAGLDWPRWRGKLKGRERLLVLAAIAALLLQVVSGLSWGAFGNYNMATTQLRVTNMLSSLAVISVFMLVPRSMRSSFAYCRPLVRLGDLSFGVYLCHMGLVMVSRKFLTLAGVSGLAYSLGVWLIALALSALAVAVCQRTFPKRLLSALGFR